MVEGVWSLIMRIRVSDSIRIVRIRGMSILAQSPFFLLRRSIPAITIPAITDGISQALRVIGVEIGFTTVVLTGDIVTVGVIM
jgi:hypothetical protein